MSRFKAHLVDILSAYSKMTLYDSAKAILEKAPAENSDLRRAVMDVMNLALKADEEIFTLRKKTAVLGEALAVKKSLILRAGVYWLPDSDSAVLL